MNIEKYINIYKEENGETKLVSLIKLDLNKSVSKYKDVYNQSPTIRQIAKISPVVLVNTIGLDIHKYLPGLNKMEIALLWDEIIDTCQNWNGLDFRLCFTNGLKGKYGKVYGDIKLADAIGWMDRYQLDERFDARQQIKHNERFKEMTNPNAIENPLSVEEKLEFDRKYRKVGLDKSVDNLKANIEIRRNGGEVQDSGFNEYMEGLGKEINETKLNNK